MYNENSGALTVSRGDIFYIRKTMTTGAEMEAGRPAIVVSNDSLNRTSMAVEVVYLTSQEKDDRPEHVVINSSGRKSTALCEQISTASLTRFSSKIGHCTEEEMRQIDDALIASLSIPVEPVECEPVTSTIMHDPDVPVSNESTELTAIRMERDFYKAQYEMLLSRLIK